MFILMSEEYASLKIAYLEHIRRSVLPLEKKIENPGNLFHTGEFNYF